MDKKTRRRLGMDAKIDRRDFLNGAAMSAASVSSLLLSDPALAKDVEAAASAAPQDRPGYYPPSIHGIRGSHPGSFDIAHSVRDGTFWQTAEKPADADGVYDLVIVGAGISGLSAAHFYRAAKPNAKILILDNHDDFGGHAKRNEYHLNGRLHLLNGGTELIDSPRPYSKVAAGVLKTLGIEPAKLARETQRDSLYDGLGPASFFDKETFGVDKLVVGGSTREGETVDWKSFIAQTPLSPKARADMLRIETGTTDYYPGLSSDEKKDKLSRISYFDYLSKVIKADRMAVAYYQKLSHDEWGIGIDAEPALDCWGFGFPGFTGLKLDPKSYRRMGNTAHGYNENTFETFHFPDGNASIARLLVREMIPEAMPGEGVENVVTSHADYSKLDREGAPVRIRLSSTVVGVRNIGSAKASKGVELAYARGGHVYRIHAANCILASWNMMIPYLCSDMPDTQKAALHELVKVPLIYTSVAVRNWRAWKDLGMQYIYAPNGYYSSCRLNWPMEIGGYRTPVSPDDPTLLFLVRTPCKPGLTERDQHRVGRADMLATTWEQFEYSTRDQIGRMLKDGGFDPKRDITGITVNRWGHGYAYEYNPLFDDFDLPPEKQPHVIGRQRWGRIAIANSDSGAAAYTDSAIDQAYRAVSEILALKA